MPQPLKPDPERQIIDFGLEVEDFSAEPAEPEQLPLLDLGLPWPVGERPIPQPWAAGAIPDPHAALPKADVLVVTWTVAEHEALADVLTPGHPRNSWARYARNFDEDYVPQIRAGAPALAARRLGSYFRTEIAGKKLLCFKSELHLNQDGKRKGEGTATLPVKDLFHQMIDEVEPSLVITVGTAGATFPPKAAIQLNGMDCPGHELGDVMITRAAQFRLSQEFKKETFAKSKYQCDSFQIPTARLDRARQILARHAAKLAEPAFGPPHIGYDWPQDGPVLGFENQPDFKIDGIDFPAFHPILTTDFFEFGTSENELWEQGCGVEMGDAVLGLAVEERKADGRHAPDWLVIRNASDPQINGRLPDRNAEGIEPQMRRGLDMQAHWAVWYYETYGYWTSVNSAIAVWAMVA
jgi:hypothetical protein